MSEARDRFINSILASVLFGAGFGLVFAALLGLLGVEGRLLVLAISRGPALVISSLSLLFGVLAAWLAQRVAGFTGKPLLVPLFACCAAAVLVGVTARDWFFGITPGESAGVLIIGAVLIWLTAGLCLAFDTR